MMITCKKIAAAADDDVAVVGWLLLAQLLLDWLVGSIGVLPRAARELSVFCAD
jgi:hypothetical protein